MLWTAKPVSGGDPSGSRNMMSVSEAKHNSLRPYPPVAMMHNEDLDG